jgi:hypothetical protein
MTPEHRAELVNDALEAAAKSLAEGENRMPSSNEPTKPPEPPSTKFTEEQIMRQLKALKRIMPSVTKKKKPLPRNVN